MQLHPGTKVVRPMPPLRLSTRSRPKTGAGLKSSMGSSSPAPGSGAKSLNSSIGSKSWPLSSSLLLSSVPDRLTDHMYPSCCTHMLRPPHSLLGPAVSLLGLPPQTTQQSFTVNQESSPHAILSPAPGPSTSGASYLLRQSGKNSTHSVHYIVPQFAQDGFDSKTPIACFIAHLVCLRHLHETCSIQEKSRSQRPLTYFTLTAASSSTSSSAITTQPFTRSATTHYAIDLDLSLS